ncbi:hypothetical protein M0657_010560 [Pyricularia oryzae]|uniref:Uncharacterized protein n=1 Tax=Pyricularia oryzae (strain P131) TaxID=1143193 RepID=L7IY80_PYRO1|nr:hypothetical protein M9X92_010526 [Pyricularia oryzae]KAI7912206.1 hypothetical protein M0657_010560 [Pyricularia oryzae]
MRYESLEGGSESVDVAVGEDATFVGVNTPDTLLKYNGNIPNITGQQGGSTTRFQSPGPQLPSWVDCGLR